LANTPDSPELIGGSFALGQWLANHDPSFKDHWITWCSEIESVQGVAQDTSVTLEAVVEVVRVNEIQKEDRKLVFKYTGPGVVNPLKIAVEGNDLLEQAYAIAAAQSFDESTVVPLPEAQVTVVTLPTIESGVTRLPSVSLAPSLPKTHSDVGLRQQTPDPNVVPPTSIVEVQTVIPTGATSAKTPAPVGAAKSALATLPEVAQPIVTVALKESATSPLPSPGATESKVVTLPEAPETIVTVPVNPEPATEASPLPSAKPSKSEIAKPPAATDRTVTPITLPEAEPVAATLPKPTRAATVKLPETTNAGVTVIPSPPAQETTLPSAGKVVSAGQYLVPIDPFPSGVSGGKTLAEAIESIVGKGVMPQAVSDVLGHLKVRKGFVAISDRFKGLVLEVEMDSPVPALVRLSLAKEKTVWAFGGEVIIARSKAKDGTPRPPLVFTLKIASISTAKSLVMALAGEVNLIDDLFRPMFGEFSIPDKIGLTVKNPVLVIVRKDQATKALVAVGLAMSVDFGELPFVGEAIKAQGDAKMSLGIQYASGPFLAPEVAEINSVLSGELQVAAPESGAVEGLKLGVSLQVTGKPLLLSIPLAGGKASNQLQIPPETVGVTEGETKPAKPTKTDEMMKWIEVNKSLGPVHLDKVGIGYADGAVQLRISGGVQISGLTFFVEGLGAGVLLAWPPKTPTFHLDGLGLVLDVPPVSVSAALVRTKIGGVDNYDGLALIKADKFTIMGLGSYSTAGDQPSLFMFAVLHAELGGPPCFRVNGLAVGFGYHRKLKLPPIEEVQNFPLVRGALEENYLKPKGLSTQELIRNAMEKLREYIPASRGDYWFAAGVRFSSFEMLQSFALLSVSFGHQVEIGLLGMSKLSIPKGAEPGKAVAYAELAIRAVVNPDEGLISVEGRLTDKSYIFTKDCHLTGGFAFYLWLKDQPAAGATEGAKGGDFVLTLGGYHSRFVRPAHYPIVPRLGVNWQVTSQLTVKAEMYFALTPSCLMTGGKLSAVFQTNNIKAWFIAYADLLLSWKPFYYLVDIGVAIRVEATVSIPLGFATITLSIRVELGVELHLWGPPFAGKAVVDLSIISFTIPFGPDKEPPQPLKAPEFVQSFLPPATSPPPVIVVRINNGLLTQREQNNEVVRVVNAHALSLTAESLIPSTSFAGLAGSAKYKQPENERPDLKSTFGVRPMAKQTLNSGFKVTLLRGVEGEFKDVGIPMNLRATFVENGVPDALWGRCEAEGQVTLPGSPEAKTIKATAGIVFSFLPLDPEHALFPIPLAKLKFEQLPTKRVVWQDFGEAATIPAPGNNTFWNTIWNNNEVDARRNAILGVLSRQSPFAMNTPKLERLQKSEHDYFQADPELATLGEQLR